jgi:hypothetical protein
MHTVPRNGIADPTYFCRNDIQFCFLHEQLTRITQALEEYPLFLVKKDDRLVVDWNFYARLESDERNRLNDILWAAGVLTSDEEGALRVREPSDVRNRYNHGPMGFNETPLFFPKNHINDAREYITAHITAMIMIDGCIGMKEIELELLPCIRKAEYGERITVYTPVLD